MPDAVVTIEREDHPVWTVYDAFRTAALNVEYDECRIAKLSRLNFCLEGAISATATGAGLTGLGALLANTAVASYWQYAWFALSVTATIAAWLKPLLKTSEKLSALEKSLAGYTGLKHDLEQIVIDVKEKQTYDEEHKRLFAAARARQRELVTQERPETYIDSVLLRECEATIRSRFPSDSAMFFTPARAQLAAQ